MSFLDVLFGKDPELDVESRGLLSPQQQAVMDNLANFFNTESIGGVRGKPFEGERVAGLSDVERLLIGEAGGVAGGISGRLAGLDEALAPALSGQVGDFEEFFQQTIAQPGIDQFEEDILPSLRRQFGPSGFFGSERREATTDATEDLTDALTRERARVGFETRESALDRVLKAAQISSGLPGEAAGALSALQPIAQTERGIEQAGLDAEYEEFLRVEVGERDKRINQMLKLLGIPTQENIGAGLPGTEGIVQAFLSGGGGGGLMNLSDRRLKSDIVRIGTTPGGLPLYRYKIFGIPRIGVMADEAPSYAVHIGPGGYSMVDYSKIW